MKLLYKAYEGLNLMQTMREWFDPSYEGNPYKKESRGSDVNKGLFSYRLKLGRKFAL